MKAAYIEQTGPAENIKYDELPTPQPKDSEVLVKVQAVAVNPVDTYIRSGAIAMNLPLPFVVGCDLAGVVESTGPNVKQFKPGDRVWGTNQGLLGRQGTFSEFAAVEEHWLYPLPEEVSFEQAAAISLVGITSHLGLIQRAKIQPGETLFVTGGSGGVGSCVVQMAKAAGAKVITSAGSEAKAETCKNYGADEVILYKQESISEGLHRLAPDGIDVFWEVAREPDFEMAVSHLRLRGRFVLMAGRDARPVFPVGPFYVKDCTLHGFAMFNAPPEEQQQAAVDINRWMQAGKLKANIAQVMPLSEAAAAHKLQEENTIDKTGTLSGKLVLKPE